MTIKDLNYDGLICARLGSSRLPGKALRKFDNGLSSLDIIFEKLKKSGTCKRVIIATTEKPEDDEIEAWAKQKGALVFRGSENDVLGRIHATISHYQCENIIEVLGDNPLVPDDLIRDVQHRFESGQFDYCASSSLEYEYANKDYTYPIGIRVQIASASFFELLAHTATQKHHREHATSLIYDDPNFARIALVSHSKKVPRKQADFNFAINTIEQFDTANALFNVLGTHFTVDELIKAWQKGGY